MYLKFISLCSVAASIVAAPPTDKVPTDKQQSAVIPIVSLSAEYEPDGTFKYSYETGNGIKREETAYDKELPEGKSHSSDSSNEGGEDDDSGEIHVQEGSYSYTAPDGTLVSVRYIADENGFQPINEHIQFPPQSTNTPDKADLSMSEAKDTEAVAPKSDRHTVEKENLEKEPEHGFENSTKIQHPHSRSKTGKKLKFGDKLANKNDTKEAEQQSKENIPNKITTIPAENTKNEQIDKDLSSRKANMTLNARQQNKRGKKNGTKDVSLEDKSRTGENEHSKEDIIPDKKTLQDLQTPSKEPNKGLTIPKNVARATNQSHELSSNLNSKIDEQSKKEANKTEKNETRKSPAAVDKIDKEEAVKHPNELNIPSKNSANNSESPVTEEIKDDKGPKILATVAGKPSKVRVNGTNTKDKSANIDVKQKDKKEMPDKQNDKPLENVNPIVPISDIATKNKTSVNKVNKVAKDELIPENKIELHDSKQEKSEEPKETVKVGNENTKSINVNDTKPVEPKLKPDTKLKTVTKDKKPIIKNTDLSANDSQDNENPNEPISDISAKNNTLVNKENKPAGQEKDSKRGESEEPKNTINEVTKSPTSINVNDTTPVEPKLKNDTKLKTVTKVNKPVINNTDLSTDGLQVGMLNDKDRKIMKEEIKPEKGRDDNTNLTAIEKGKDNKIFQKDLMHGLNKKPEQNSSQATSIDMANKKPTKEEHKLSNDTVMTPRVSNNETDKPIKADEKSSSSVDAPSKDNKKSTDDKKIPSMAPEKIENQHENKNHTDKDKPSENDGRNKVLGQAIVPGEPGKEQEKFNTLEQPTAVGVGDNSKAGGKKEGAVKTMNDKNNNETKTVISKDKENNPRKDMKEVKENSKNNNVVPKMLEEKSLQNNTKEFQKPIKEAEKHEKVAEHAAKQAVQAAGVAENAADEATKAAKETEKFAKAATQPGHSRTLAIKAAKEHAKLAGEAAKEAIHAAEMAEIAAEDAKNAAKAAEKVVQLVQTSTSADDSDKLVHKLDNATRNATQSANKAVSAAKDAQRQVMLTENLPDVKKYSS